MGRRGVKSSRDTGRGSKREKMFDVSEVVPLVLFPLLEEDNEVDKGGKEVMIICKHNEILC
jgi:hypothetical protein